MVRRRFRKVAKDKKTGVAKKYLSGAKNKAAKAAEIKRTSAAYKRGEFIDIQAVSKIVSRVMLGMLLENKDFIKTFRDKFMICAYELLHFESQQENDNEYHPFDDPLW